MWQLTRRSQRPQVREAPVEEAGGKPQWQRWQWLQTSPELQENSAKFYVVRLLNHARKQQVAKQQSSVIDYKIPATQSCLG